MSADETARTDQLTEERHYIGVFGEHGRLHTTLTNSPGRWADSTYADPRDPIPVGHWRTPPDADGPLLYPVSAAVAEAFMDDDDGDGDGDGDDGDDGDGDGDGGDDEDDDT